MDGCVAVLDVGKTNVKVVLFDRDGHVVSEHSRRNAPLPPDATWRYLRLDTEGVWRFLVEALREAGAKHRIAAISISTHGGAGALVARDGLALPPLDYDDDMPADVYAEYEALRPPFNETLSPSLPRGLNLGRQFFYFFRRYPEAAARAVAMLAYPQYWSWRLSGVAATEVTSLGSHTDLWRPREGELSSLVDKLGWRKLFPPLRRAWESLGTLKPEVVAETGLSPDVRIYCGVHDSNASLVPYLPSLKGAFTMLSTGTWIIIFAVGSKAALDPKADMLANVDVRGSPVPCARFMGGREFAVIAGDAPPAPDMADVAAVVASGAMALPSFSDQGGPFIDRKGRIEGVLPDRPAARAALATLYAALMTDHLVERLEGASPLIIDGGFARTPAYAAILAAMKPDRTVYMASATAGAAEGAALLAHWGEPFPPRAQTTAPRWLIPGLADYRARWLAKL